MPSPWLIPLVALALVALMVPLWRRARTVRQAQERLADFDAPPVGAAAEAIETPRRAAARPLVRRHPLVVLALGAAVGLAAWLAAGLSPLFAGTFAAMVTLVAWQLDGWWAARRTAQLETQLSDLIDLLASALGAGSGVTAALEHALVDARPPLRPLVEQILARLRYGDAPARVFEDFARRGGTDPFRLTATTLAVHWEVGGSLAPPLSSVGRVVRDRMELERRLRAMSTHARASVLSLLGITYFIAYVSWVTDPERMAGFLGTGVGQGFVAAAMILQCVGLVWIGYLSRPRF